MVETYGKDLRPRDLDATLRLEYRAKVHGGEEKAGNVAGIGVERKQGGVGRRGKAWRGGLLQ